jgi:hypothetical protein
MKKFIVEIQLDNDAFNPLPHLEVARILNTVARKIDEDDFQDDAGFFLFDSYGNKVGLTKYSED